MLSTNLHDYVRDAKLRCGYVLRRCPGIAAGLLATVGALSLLAGCAGALSAGSLIGSSLIALALLLHGCTKERCAEYDTCVDGEAKRETLCCPEGDECNYGWPISMCDDGTCRPAGESCPESLMDGGTDAGCDGVLEQGCFEGVLERRCCPAGQACNYGLGLMYCGGQSCSYTSCESCDSDAGDCPDAG
jgi:hypothetical protein